MINTNYLKTLQIIESFCSAHIQVKRFKSDFLEQLQNFGHENEEYPVVYVTPVNGLISDNDFTHLNQFTVNVYCVDVIQQDRANINPILNNTYSILNDLQLFLKEDLPGIQVISTSSLTPLSNYLLDKVAGWYMALTVEVETYSVCEIPFSTPPVVSHFINDIVYNPYIGPTGATGATGSPASNYERRSDYQAPYLYCGFAPAGTPESTGSWNIDRITVNIDGSSITESAVGAWTNRYSLIYT